ncbi:hypothetical protein QYM36_007268 [Artemia franciscana]|uniref:Uncharacterized protein n=1 Tax=Artemia franciscana TaxID=6661 RepID=A0AA88HXP9_ARTSF|nr:hypothetical protein QYM36_007268 [Artemia franciscana]
MSSCLITKSVDMECNIATKSRRTMIKIASEIGVLTDLQKFPKKVGHLTHTIKAIKEIAPASLVHLKRQLLSISTVEQVQVPGKSGPSRESKLQRGEIADATGKIKVTFWGETGCSGTNIMNNGKWRKCQSCEMIYRDTSNLKRSFAGSHAILRNAGETYTVTFSDNAVKSYAETLESFWDEDIIDALLDCETVEILLNDNRSVVLHIQPYKAQTTQN